MYFFIITEGCKNIAPFGCIFALEKFGNQLQNTLSFQTAIFMCKQNIQFTKGQQNAFDQMMKFVESQDSKVYILRGYAGTGKTTLVKSLVKKLDEKGFEHVLLASTGRCG